jgi:hypothetical protein
MDSKEQKNRSIFLENIYDIEILFESLDIASKGEKELQYMDKLISYIRLDPNIDLTELNYKILNDLKLINVKGLENGKNFKWRTS